MTDMTPEQPAPPAMPPQTFAQPQTEFISDKKGRPIQVILGWVLAVCTFGYMLPWAIAATRGKSNTGAIGVLNLLLGWTLIGWIIALVMACGTHQKGLVQRY